MTQGDAPAPGAWKGLGGRRSTETWAAGPASRLFAAGRGNARVLVRRAEGALLSGCR